MSLSLAVLTKKAIDASLQQKWDEATKLNLEILKIYPKNLDAKIRLGRCYLQNRDFTKAKKVFKEVLSVDPINSLALKNYELAKNQKVECNNGNGKLSTKSLLKEPGTTCETKITLKAKGITEDDFTSGEELVLKVKKSSIDVYKYKKNKKVLLGSIDDNYIVQRINCAISKKCKVTATFVKKRGEEILLLIKASMPVFKPDKIEIRPYLKKGTIDEPELEIEEEEDIE